ncbi:MAG: YbjN domain-containing protein [Eubacteriales bacterium]|nr:YbjN domain-containing protein [Eubacteriales bacterium]
MSKTSAEAFIEQLKQNNIRHIEDVQPNGSHFVAVELAGKSNVMYSIAMIFSPDSQEYGIRCYKLGKVPKERRQLMLEKLNDLNANYAWVRFFLDSDDDVAAALDAIVTPESAAHVCWEMLRCFFVILDELQETIDTVLK